MYPNPNIDTANETTEYTEIGPDPDIKPTERASYVARPNTLGSSPHGWEVSEKGSARWRAFFMSSRKRPLSALAVATSAAGDEDPRRATGGTAIIRVEAGDAGHGRPNSSASHASAGSSATEPSVCDELVPTDQETAGTVNWQRHLVDNHTGGTENALRRRPP